MMRTLHIAVAALMLTVSACGGSSSNTSAKKFSTDVYPIFSEVFGTLPVGNQRCIDCHAAGQDAPGFPFTGSVAAVYGVAKGLVSTSNAVNSPLYRRPLGLDGHPGGKLFDATSPEALAILSWIENGAPND